MFDTARKISPLTQTVALRLEREAGLTPEELRVLEIIVSGCTVKEAAIKLKKNADTLKAQIRFIVVKLHVRRVSAAITVVWQLCVEEERKRSIFDPGLKI